MSLRTMDSNNSQDQTGQHALGYSFVKPSDLV